MKWIFAAMLFTGTAHSDPIKCLANTLYQEARGTTTEEMVLVGLTVRNWHESTQESICEATRKWYTSKTPPSNVAPIYHALARDILNGNIPDSSHGADRFNEGRRPAYHGEIKRVTNKFVFYKLRR